MATQFIQATFSDGGVPYTYLNEEPDDVEVGDFVQVTTPAGSVREILVVAVSTSRPADLPSYVDPKQCYKVPK